MFIFLVGSPCTLDLPQRRRAILVTHGCNSFKRLVSRSTVVTLYSEGGGSAMHTRHEPSNIPIELLRTFIAISEHGSFSQAGVALNLTQAAISSRMKRLERLVGGELFVRKAIGVGLSDTGSLLESHAHRILTLNDQVMAIAGRSAENETIRLGLQSVFARVSLTDVVNKLSLTATTPYQFFCNSAPDLRAALRSGYVDLAFKAAQTKSRHNLLAEWNEKLVWLRAPHFVVADDEPIPIIGRGAEGFMARKIIAALDDCNVPYRIVFRAGDLWTYAAAAEAGLGVMAVPQRIVSGLSDSLVIAQDRILPKLPELRTGVFVKEGFDLQRNKSLVEAFLSAVQPPRHAR